MHQIQPIRSIKRLFKKYRREHKAQAEDKQTRSIQKDENFKINTFKIISDANYCFIFLSVGVEKREV